MSPARASKRRRGAISWLPSGSARVKVYLGVDQLTGQEIWLRETVKARATEARDRTRSGEGHHEAAEQGRRAPQPKTEATVNELLDRWLEIIGVEKTTRTGYVGKIEKHIRPTIGRLQVARVRAETIENLYVQLRRCRDHCRGAKYIHHRTEGEHDCDEHSARRKCAKEVTGDPEALCRWCERACGPHRCAPLAAASIRVVHAILSGSFTRAVRWGWIAVSPIEQTEPPPTPRPNPSPPTAAEAALILEEAWKDPDWGVFVLFTMTTGARRGEVCGLRWSHLNLDAGVAVFKASIGQIAGERWEKDTKTHQHRRVTLDAELVDVLRAHLARCEERAASVDTKVRRDGFVFSRALDGSTMIHPNAVTQRYGRLARRVGIVTHLHCLRRYSATELVAAGVDIRTVAGRLGHAGGGSTTLRTYTAFVHEADQRAATALASRRSKLPHPNGEQRPSRSDG